MPPAPLTKQILGGKTPVQFDESLLNSRAKRDLVASEKAKKFPAGTGVNGQSSS